MESFSQTQWPNWAYQIPNDTFSTYSQLSNYPQYLAESMETYQAHQQHLVHHNQMSRTTETKPRLSKEEVELLESEFQKNHKPNSSTKKALAESMRVDNARINNWFQNRRAREKKENNIRQYEAKQKLEKEMANSDSTDREESCSRDLVASSAPFPPSRQPTHTIDASEDGDKDSEDLATSHDDGSDRFSSATPSDHQGFIQRRYYGEDVKQEDGDGKVTFSTAEFGLEFDDKNPNYLFGQWRGFMGSDSLQPPSSFPPRTMCSDEGNHTSIQQSMRPNGCSPIDSGTSSSSSAYDVSTRASSVPDIASRRQRRPPPLAIQSSRSYSSGIPRAGLDWTKKAELSKTMRRVASASGPMRVTKPQHAQRGNMMERSPGGTLHCDESLSVEAPNGSAAPPTPNTPIIVQQLGQTGAPSVDGYDKAQSSENVARDPTLRTPPTTPGVAEGIFSIDSAYDMSFEDEALITPSFGRFTSDFEMPHIPTAVPAYVAGTNTYSGHAETASMPASIGPVYYGLAGGNTEYNWSDAAASGGSSPEQIAHRVPFVGLASTTYLGEH